MKNLKMRKIIIVLITLLMLTTVATKVFAIDDPLGALTGNKPGTTTNVEGVKFETDQKPTTNTLGTTNALGDNKDGTLPKTGDASDYIVFMAIGACLIVSVLAYKKVKEYNKI